MTSLKIRSLQAFCYRYPLATPVVTSFGRMNDRPAVFVRVEDEDGEEGWGEVWCNFPSVGAEHRARLINEMLAPMWVRRDVAQPSELFDTVTAATSVLALQSGEQGPFAQVIAGIDAAVWDLFARRARTPLWRMLGGASGRMRVYASGINPDGSVAMAEAAMWRGHRAFKLKIGFGANRDRDNLRALRELIGKGMLAVDVNQGWSLPQALEQAPPLEEFALAWLEEPLRADRPWSEWRALRERLSLPLAGGENIVGREAFASALAEGVLSVSSLTSRNGAASPAASRWRASLPRRTAFIARIILGAVSAFWPPHICLLPAMADGSKSTATTIRCARPSAARSPPSRTARSNCRKRLASTSSRILRRSKNTARSDVVVPANARLRGRAVRYDRYQPPRAPCVFTYSA
jgi:L-alanine-DL-glutamate epimerase-like enolase superfamily enzyme